MNILGGIRKSWNTICILLEFEACERINVYLRVWFPTILNLRNLQAQEKSCLIEGVNRGKS